MRSGRFALATALVIVVSLLAASCYTIQAPKKKKKKSDSAVAVSTELHALIVEYVEEALYTYPQVATRVGMHVYVLPSGEKIDLDRELPNYSDAVVDARIETLEAYLQRLDKKAPEDALCLSDLADRRLLSDAIQTELHQLSVLKIHTRNPIVHVAALAEAVYYPMVVEYGPENERLGDVLGRMHWIPSYVDRAIRMLEHSSAAYNEAAIAINAWTIELVGDAMPQRVDATGDKELGAAFSGMKQPVVESLEKLQKFLEKDLPKKSKRTWRLGDEQYERVFALTFHGLTSPGKAVSDAEARIEKLRREMFSVAKPVYCEHNEKDGEVCGPTKAEIAAAKQAEEDRLRKEEEAEKKAEEKKKAEEAKKKAAEEKKKKAEEEKKKAEEAKKKAAKEKKKKAEEAKKKAEEEAEEAEDEGEEKDITNPYEKKKKKKEKKKKGGVDNPYGLLLLPPPLVLGAKVADDGDDEDVPGLDNVGGVDAKTANDKMIQRVVAWTLEFAAKEEGAGGKALPRVKEFAPEMADMARRIDLLSTVKSSGMKVRPMPVSLAALGYDVEFVPQPVFQPELGGHLFVAAGEDVDGLDDARLKLLTAVSGAPGQLEVYRRGVDLDAQTRRATRVLFADQAFVRGWALYATAELAAGYDSWSLELIAMSELLIAAASVVVDVKLHSGGMSDKDAVELLVDQAFLSSDAAEIRTAQAKVSPAQIAAPFLGYQAWRDARGQLKKKLKKGFSAKGFHEKALDLGPVPVSQLGTLLTSDDPDAAPEFEMEVIEEDEKTTFSFIDAF